MAIKEMYEEMSDIELLERYKTIEDYQEGAKPIMLEEIRKRKLVSEEEIEKKLKTLHKKMSEPKKIVKKRKGNNYYISPNQALAGLIIPFAIGLMLINLGIYDFFQGAYTIPWKETNATIVKIDKQVKLKKIKNKIGETKEIETYSGNILYTYSVENKKYTGGNISYNKISKIHESNKTLKESNVGDTISIKYNPRSPNQSIIFGFSFKSLWYLAIGLFLILIFVVLIQKADDDFDDFNIMEDKKNIIFVTIVLESALLILFRIF